MERELPFSLGRADEQPTVEELLVGWIIPQVLDS